MMESPKTATTPPMTQEGSGEGLDATPKKRLRILYAEDMRELRDLASISLTLEGHMIECAENGAIALEKLRLDPSAYDLLISDHHMPKMNGLQLVVEVRALLFAGRIMIFSSELSREVQAGYRQLKVDKILNKPVFPSMLRKVLEEMEKPGAAPA